jgi:glycosyltransferase involved in cell wall biosynthesis
MIQFSIILPTRERLVGLQKTLDSFENMTDKLDELEMLLVMDKDDPTKDMVQELINKYHYSVIALVRDRSEHFCRDYYNWGAAKSKGKNIMMFNDDCTMLTKGWDTIIKKKVGSRQVYLVDLWDSTHEDLNSFPRFPMLSRKAYEAQGFFFHPTIRMWGTDVIVYKTFEAAGAVVECHEVELFHDHMPSRRFADMYEQDKKNGVFPVPVLDEIAAIATAKEEYDGREYEDFREYD